MMIKPLFLNLAALLCMGVSAQDSLVRYYHANGRLSSEGALRDGKPEGWWRNYHENGALRSEGGRKSAMLDSVWSFFDEQGRKETEIAYKNDRKEGMTIQFDTSGAVLAEIPYSNDLREGVAVYYDVQGRKRKEVPFKAGREEGKGFEYAADGRVTALLHYGAGMLRRREDINQTDRQGMRQGPWKEFHANGRVRWEGAFVDDKRHGIFKEYDAQGNLKELAKYDGGVVDTGAAEKLTVEIKRTFHSNGKVASLGGYSKSGKREGLFKEFSTDGSIKGARLYQGDQLLSEGLVNEAGAWKDHGWSITAPGRSALKAATRRGRRMATGASTIEAAKWSSAASTSTASHTGRGLGTTREEPPPAGVVPQGQGGWRIGGI